MSILYQIRTDAERRAMLIAKNAKCAPPQGNAFVEKVLL